MSELRIDCPHCGSSFNVMLDGEPSSMMVFACAKCKTPLMYCGGVTSELDRDEFQKLRERLVRVLNGVMNREGTMSDVAASLKHLVEDSNALAESRHESEKPVMDGVARLCVYLQPVLLYALRHLLPSLFRQRTV